MGRKRKPEADKILFDREKKCAWCGKVFYAYPEHVFKIRNGERTLFFCKYTCMLRFREERDRQKKYKKKGM